jgi:NADPH-dependent ferric siderophore reductase
VNPFYGTVRRTARLSAGLVRLTLQHETLHSFPSTGVGDEYVRVHFPDESGELREPRIDGDNWVFDGEYPHVQPYTVRRHDAAAGEIDIDFVLHGHGRAAAFASAAKPGDRLMFGSPRGLYEAPEDVGRCVFVTDATGIPALGRLLEQLGDHAHALAVVEIAEDGHQIEFESAARLDVQWIVGRGNGVAPSAMTEVLRSVELTDDTYVWVAGEAGELREARRHLRHDRALSATRYKVIGYWRHNVDEWLSRWNALDEETTRRLRDVFTEVADQEQALDIYDEQLERLGL